MDKKLVTDVAKIYDVSRKTIERWCYAAEIEIEIDDGRAYCDMDALLAAGRKIFKPSNVQSEVVNVQSQPSNVQSKVAYDWTSDGAEALEALPEGERKTQLRSLHGGYIAANGRWYSTVGGTESLAKDSAVCPMLRPVWLITKKQWTNWTSRPQD